MQMRRYFQEGTGPVAYAPPEDEDEDQDQDENDTSDPGSDASIQQQIQGGAASPASIPEGPPGNYLSGPGEEDAPSDALVPGMVGVRADDLAPPTAPPTAPAAPQQPSEYQTALKALGKLYDQYPQRKAPNWMERVAAGVLGGAAGWSNAARRAAPIDIAKTTEGILHPGYESKLQEWQSRVVPAQQAVELAGQQAAAGWKGQQIQNETQLKSAQTQMNLDRAKMYNSMAENRGRFRVDTKTGQVFDTTTGTFVQKPETIDDILKRLPPDLPRDQALNYALTVTSGGKYTAPRVAATPRPPAANASLLAIRATGATTGNPQVDAMPPEAAKRAIEISKPRDPLTDVLAQDRLNDARDKRNTDLDQWKVTKEAETKRNFEQQIQAAQNTTNKGPNYNAEAEINNVRNNARTALQDIQDRYARTIRQRGGSANDLNVIVRPDNSVGYEPRVPAPPAIAPVAVPPRAPGPGFSTSRPSHNRYLRCAHSTGPPAAGNPGGVSVTLPNGKVKAFPNQQALEAISGRSRFRPYPTKGNGESDLANYDPGSALLGPPDQFPAPVDANARRAPSGT